MPIIKKSTHVNHKPNMIYELVNDVSKYKDFVPWCSNSVIIDGVAEEWIIAKLEFDFHGIKQSFTTKNTLTPYSTIDIELVDGPFSKLEGIWQFKSINEGCEIQLELEYIFINNWLGHVFEPAFVQISSLLVNTFKDRAYEVYR